MTVLNEEQIMLRDAAKDWAGERAPVTALRRRRDQGLKGFDPALWKEMGEMGWSGVVAPEAYGGSDFGYRALGLILEETGRTLTNSPLLSTALIGVTALRLGGTSLQKEAWLPGMASGETIATLALEERPHHAPERSALKVEKTEAGWRLDGRKTFVLDGMAADLFIIVARSAGSPGETDGLSLFLAPATATGLKRTALDIVDSREAADLVLDGVVLPNDALLGREGSGFSLLEQILDRARAGIAAEMTGAAAQAFDITLEYLKTRTQFGQLIGSFQALQHRAAKMFTALEMTRSCVEAALDAIDHDANDVRALCSLAKAKASETAHLVSNEMVQMHGGIGMTDAHDAGLYMKRARVAEALFGGAAFHRDRYATLMGF